MSTLGTELTPRWHMVAVPSVGAHSTLSMPASVPTVRLFQSSSCLSGTVILEVSYLSSETGLMQSCMHSVWLETYPPHRTGTSLTSHPLPSHGCPPHLHAVSQDKLIDDEGDEVPAAHLPRDD